MIALRGYAIRRIAPPEPAEDEDKRSTPLSDPDVGLPWMNPAEQ